MTEHESRAASEVGAATAASSIFRRAMGEEFERLHPQLRRRFGVSLADGRGVVGLGVMDRMWHGTAGNRRLTAPLLRLGGHRHLVPPVARGRVPFLIENYPYVDPHGREAVSFVRTFAVGSRQHRFDATMVYCDRRGAVVDYLGAHHDFGVDLSFTALPDGALQIRTSGFRVYAGPIAGTLPAVLTGRALVRESFDEAIGCFRIDVRVTNPVVGPLFGYEGRFSMRSVDADRLPSQVRPVRAERRM